MSNHNTIITDQTNYQIDTKILSIHSNDRDTTKWLYPSLFEIELPQEYYNIQTIRLLNINFTNVEKVFSYYKKNTKFSFSISLYEKTFTITIEDGNYTGEELASEIQYKMNKALNDHVSTLSYDDMLYEIYTNNLNIFNKDQFTVAYNKVTDKIYFGNLYHEFNLLFDNIETYNIETCNLSSTNYLNINNMAERQLNNNNANKGFFYYIGYNNIEYKSSTVDNNQVFGYNNKTWLNLETTENNIGWIIQHNIPGELKTEKDSIQYYNITTVKLENKNVFYMEIERFNNCDELIENPMNSSSLSDPNKSCFKNTYGGKVDSFFCKIITSGIDSYSATSQSINGLLHNCSKIFTPPLENLRKLKFKFRYHNGSLVNFYDQDINFTLEINSIRNEIRNGMTVNKPTYKGF